MCLSFGRVSEDLCESVVSIARKLCRNYVHPIGIEVLMVSRLIVLCKDPVIQFQSWIADLNLLSDIAESQPQATYPAFVHGVYSRSYFFRSCSVPVDHLNCLEGKISYRFITTLLSSINDLERDWLALPNRFWGMGLIYPTQYSSSQYQASLAITQRLVDCLLKREKELPFEVMKKIIDEYSSKRAQEKKLRALSLRERLDSDHH